MRRVPMAGVLLAIIVLSAVLPSVAGFGGANNLRTLQLSEPDRIKIANGIAREERRKLEREKSQRKLCEGCQRPPVLCLCEALPSQKFDSNTTILILQHPNEFRKKTFSTVPLISLVMKNVHVKVGYRFEIKDLPLVSDFLSQGRSPLLLFPGDDALSLDSGINNEEEGNHSVNDTRIGRSNLLILLDGTWAEAKRMAKESPELMKVVLPVTFSPTEPSLYNPIRKEPEAHCYSTLEASARALVLLEAQHEASNSLTNVLNLMVHTKLLTVAENQHVNPRKKGRKRESRRRQYERIETALFRQHEPRWIDDSGALLRPLTVDDVDIVNENCCRISINSDKLTEKLISSGVGCLGIELDGRLRAHIVRCEDGCLGMLHVDAQLRGRGYGKLLIREASMILGMAGLPQMALIKHGNIAAEAAFRSAGWTTTDDKLIKHEGRLRQRWIPQEG